MYLENKKNDEFNKFFKKFKEENKDKWANIINGKEIDLDVLRQETAKELEQKYTVLKQMSDRNKLKIGIDKFDTLSEKTLEEENNLYNLNPVSKLNLTGRRSIKKKNILRPKSTNAAVALAPDPEEGETYDSKKFNLIFIDSAYVCKITPLQRIYHRKVIIFAGNKEGMITYGVGTGELYEDAWTNAFIEMKKNLILVNWDPIHTFPRDVSSRHHDFRIMMRSSLRPYWFCNPIVLLLIRYTGLYHCNFNTISRKKKPLSVLFAIFKLATNNTTYKILAEEKGNKLRHMKTNRGLNSVNHSISNIEKKTNRISLKI